MLWAEHPQPLPSVQPANVMVARALRDEWSRAWETSPTASSFCALMMSGQPVSREHKQDTAQETFKISAFTESTNAPCLRFAPCSSLSRSSLTHALLIPTPCRNREPVGLTHPMSRVNDALVTNSQPTLRTGSTRAGVDGQDIGLKGSKPQVARSAKRRVYLGRVVKKAQRVGHLGSAPLEERRLHPEAGRQQPGNADSQRVHRQEVGLHRSLPPAFGMVV